MKRTSLHILVPKPKGVPDDDDEPSGALLVHYREQFEAAVNEILTERGYTVTGWTSAEDGSFDVLFVGKEPVDTEMLEVMQIAALRCGYMFDEEDQ